MKSYLIMRRNGGEHASRADLPADEIVEVVGTVLVRPDPEPASV